MKRLLASLLLTLALALALPAHAEETRMDRLQNSRLIDGLKPHDPWQVTFTPNTAINTCVECVSLVTARISVDTEAPENAGLDAIINNPKEVCAHLATQEGRCISAQPFQLRGGTIKGLRFEIEMYGCC